MPASMNSLDTSPMRRMFSVRSSCENPRFLFKPCRTLSPSRAKMWMPLLNSLSWVSTAIVDLPALGSPVSQMTAERWPLACARSSRVMTVSCHLIVLFLEGFLVIFLLTMVIVLVQDDYRYIDTLASSKLCAG